MPRSKNVGVNTAQIFGGLAASAGPAAAVDGVLGTTIDTALVPHLKKGLEAIRLELDDLAISLVGRHGWKF